MADPVYVRIERPEGYEDVCSELVIEDAIPSTAFHIADATAEVARLREALKEIDQKFLSDDNWTDAVATVKYLSGDGGTFADGPPEPPPESPAPSPARDGFDPICPRCRRPLSDHYPDHNNDPVCGDFPADASPARDEVK